MVELVVVLAEVLIYVAWSVGGAVAYILVAKGWGDKPEVARRVAIAVIVGLLVWELKLPNNITAFGLGYFGIDTVSMIAERLKPKPVP